MDDTSARAGARAPFAARTPERVLLPNGVELHGVTGGEGTPLVFIHGAMGDWRSFEPQWAAFAQRYRCLAYSRRYSFPNRNDMPSPHHSALDEAEDLRLLLDQLGWQRAILVGSSYGGFTALAFAVAHPERVLAIAAVEPPMMKYAHRTPGGQAAAAAFRREVIEPANAAFRAGDDELGGRIMTGGIVGGAAIAATPGAMQRRLQNLRAMRMLALSSDEFPLLAPQDLADLPMPVLLLSGANTPALHREIFANVCAAMPQARCLRVAHAGHGVSREQPQVFNTAVLEFLRSSLPTA